MVFGYVNANSVVHNIKDPGADNIYLIWRAPARLSKVEILEAWAVCDTEVATGSGESIALRLLDYGATGIVNAGTISAILGGTAVAEAWTACVPRAFTISEGTLDGGDYLCLQYDESGTIAFKNLTVGFNWVEGATQ